MNDSFQCDDNIDEGNQEIKEYVMTTHQLCQNPLVERKGSATQIRLSPERNISLGYIAESQAIQGVSQSDWDKTISENFKRLQIKRQDTSDMIQLIRTSTLQLMSFQEEVKSTKQKHQLSSFAPDSKKSSSGNQKRFSVKRNSTVCQKIQSVQSKSQFSLQLLANIDYSCQEKESISSSSEEGDLYILNQKFEGRVVSLALPEDDDFELQRNYNSLYFDDFLYKMDYKQQIEEIKGQAMNLLNNENCIQRYKGQFQSFPKKSKCKYFNQFKRQLYLILTRLLLEQNLISLLTRHIMLKLITNKMYVYFRPHAQELLRELSQHFELIVFTAACMNYAEIVVDLLEDNSIYFDYILHREQCVYVKEQKTFIKDLQLLSLGREMKDMVLIDNKVKSYMLNMENGIPIKDFMGDPTDDTLLVLKQYLIKLLDVEDVRTSIRRDFIQMI